MMKPEPSTPYFLDWKGTDGIDLYDKIGEWAKQAKDWMEAIADEEKKVLGVTQKPQPSKLPCYRCGESLGDARPMIHNSISVLDRKLGQWTRLLCGDCYTLTVQYIEQREAKATDLKRKVIG